MALTIFSYNGVAWKFKSPGALRHDGSWEHIVRSENCELYDIVGSRRGSEEVLGTTFCLVEQA